MDEALVFWKKAFSKKISEDKFNKEYAYNVRHSYGQEGKRANYAPYNCVKVITSNEPSAGDHHGCPFKHFSADNLRATLLSRNVSERTIQEILELVRHQHFQIACTRYFEASRKTEEQMDMIAHPNEYFDRSLKLSKVNKLNHEMMKQ
jgi:DNA primase large subunit